MNKQYFKQAIQSIRENPLVSTISIAGTALSIAMIMVVVMIFQIHSANYAPETKRDRMLYIQGTQIQFNTTKNRGQMSAEVVRECFYKLQTPEAVTAISNKENMPVSVPGKRMFNTHTIKYTDSGFWKLFEFDFLEGRPFSQEEFSSGIAAAVISDELAKELFGSTDVVGKICILDFKEYTIRGVVKSVTKAAKEGFANIWVPYTSKSSLVSINNQWGNMEGRFTVYILAKKRSDFESIKEEQAKLTAAYNAGKKDYKVDFLNNPITRLDVAIGSTGFEKKPLKDYLIQTGSVLLFLLLVPALNLTGVIQSSVQKRQAEIGVRKAFGATQQKILSQILCENLVVTCIGMVVGTILSFLFLYIGKSFLLSEDTSLTSDMLFKPGLFIAALIFTFLLNLLSAGVPAFHISGKKITDSLKKE